MLLRRQLPHEIRASNAVLLRLLHRCSPSKTHIHTISAWHLGTYLKTARSQACPSQAECQFYHPRLALCRQHLMDWEPQPRPVHLASGLRETAGECSVHGYRLGSSATEAAQDMLSRNMERTLSPISTTRLESEASKAGRDCFRDVGPVGHIGPRIEPDFGRPRAGLGCGDSGMSSCCLVLSMFLDLSRCCTTPSCRDKRADAWRILGIG